MVRLPTGWKHFLPQRTSFWGAKTRRRVFLVINRTQERETELQRAGERVELQKYILKFVHFISFSIGTDDGEGHVGTVCEIGRCGSTHSPENTVVVNWDSGHRTNYRVGYQNQYDLIIVDNAQVGK